MPKPLPDYEYWSTKRLDLYVFTDNERRHNPFLHRVLLRTATVTNPQAWYWRVDPSFVGWLVTTIAKAESKGYKISVVERMSVDLIRDYYAQRYGPWPTLAEAATLPPLPPIPPGLDAIARHYESLRWDGWQPTIPPSAPDSPDTAAIVQKRPENRRSPRDRPSGLF